MWNVGMGCFPSVYYVNDFLLFSMLVSTHWDRQVIITLGSTASNQRTQYPRTQYQRTLTTTQATLPPPTATPIPAPLHIHHCPPPPKPPPPSDLLLLSSSEPSQPAPYYILTATPQHYPSALTWQPTPSGVE